jgi:hypothetical protein
MDARVLYKGCLLSAVAIQIMLYVKEACLLPTFKRCLEHSCVSPVKVPIQYTNYASHSEDVYIRYIPTIHKKLKLISPSNEQTKSNQPFFKDTMKKIQPNK